MADRAARIVEELGRRLGTIPGLTIEGVREDDHGPGRDWLINVEFTCWSTTLHLLADGHVSDPLYEAENDILWNTEAIRDEVLARLADRDVGALVDVIDIGMTNAIAEQRRRAAIAARLGVTGRQDGDSLAHLHVDAFVAESIGRNGGSVEDMARARLADPADVASRHLEVEVGIGVLGRLVGPGRRARPMICLPVDLPGGAVFDGVTLKLPDAFQVPATTELAMAGKPLGLLVETGTALDDRPVDWIMPSSGLIILRSEPMRIQKPRRSRPG